MRNNRQNIRNIGTMFEQWTRYNQHMALKRQR